MNDRHLQGGGDFCVLDSEELCTDMPVAQLGGVCATLVTYSRETTQQGGPGTVFVRRLSDDPTNVALAVVGKDLEPGKPYSYDEESKTFFYSEEGEI